MEMILIALGAGAVEFHLNDVRVDAVDGGAESFYRARDECGKNPQVTSTRIPDRPVNYFRA